MLRVLDLFSGIGGFSLGLERAGMRTVAFCEIEPYCRAVLRKHWPDVPIYEDVTALSLARLSADGIAADVLCGGFPCQDISLAGKGAGLAGERSGLWREYHRLIAEIGPRWAIIENVSALRSRGLDQVLWSLAEIGYDAEWHCIPASAVGAPHRRDRIWIIAYPQADAPRSDANGIGSHRAPLHEHGSAEFRDEQIGDSGSVGESVSHPHGQSEHAGAVDAEVGGAPEPVADAARDLLAQQAACGTERERAWPGGQSISMADAEGWTPRSGDDLCARQSDACSSGQAMADADNARLEGWIGAELQECAGERTSGESDSFSDTGRPAATRHGSGERTPSERDWWLAEPDVGRVAHGIPSRVDRLRALGNAVVPQIPEIIGRAILACHAARNVENGECQ